MTILESKVQQQVCSYARINGWYVRKFSSPGRRNVPDCVFVKGAVGEPVSVFFIEFKQLGKQPRKGQRYEFQKIERQGVSVYIIDEWFRGKRLVDREDARLSTLRRKAVRQK